MWVYALIMFVLTAVFLTIAYSVYRGFLPLIHAYHWKNVRREDYSAYGHAMGIGLFAFGFTFLLSGGISLFGESAWVVYSSLGVLAVGMIAGLVIFGWAQKKYNGGWF